MMDKKIPKDAVVVSSTGISSRRKAMEMLDQYVAARVMNTRQSAQINDLGAVTGRIPVTRPSKSNLPKDDELSKRHYEGIWVTDTEMGYRHIEEQIEGIGESYQLLPMPSLTELGPKAIEAFLSLNKYEKEEPVGMHQVEMFIAKHREPGLGVEPIMVDYITRSTNEHLDALKYAMMDTRLTWELFFGKVEHFPVDYKTLEAVVLLSMLITVEKYIHDETIIYAPDAVVVDTPMAEFILLQKLVYAINTDAGRRVIGNKIKQVVTMDTVVFIN